jgi:transcriptional regulator with XRE-family HTH domain
MPIIDDKALGKRLRKARLQAGLRQVDLAQILSERQSFVSKYESGERRLGFLEVLRVCRALGTRASDLARELEDEALQ